MVIFGGRGFENFNDIWIFDLGMGKWMKVVVLIDGGVNILECCFSMVYGIEGDYFYVVIGEFFGDFDLLRCFFNDILCYEFLM